MPHNVGGRNGFTLYSLSNILTNEEITQDPNGGLYLVEVVGLR